MKFQVTHMRELHSYQWQCADEMTAERWELQAEFDFIYLRQILECVWARNHAWLLKINYQILLGEGIAFLCLYGLTALIAPCPFVWILKRRPYCCWRWGPVLNGCNTAKGTLSLRDWGPQMNFSLWRFGFFHQQKRGALFIEHDQNLRKLFLPKGPEWVWISQQWAKTVKPHQGVPEGDENTVFNSFAICVYPHEPPIKTVTHKNTSCCRLILFFCLLLSENK